MYWAYQDNQVQYHHDETESRQAALKMAREARGGMLISGGGEAFVIDTLKEQVMWGYEATGTNGNLWATPNRPTIRRYMTGRQVDLLLDALEAK